MKAVSIRPTADVQPAPIIAMRTITLLLLLLAGLIAAVTTAPIPSPDAHHGGKEGMDGLSEMQIGRKTGCKPNWKEFDIFIQWVALACDTHA